MTIPPIPQNEDRRLRRLAQLGLLDTQAEAVLDGFTSLAAAMTGMPAAVIGLVDRYREWWKSAVGLPQGGFAPREASLCSQALGAPAGFFELEDARLDPHSRSFPMVQGEPFVVHYAAAVLEMPTGERIGTLAVIGHQPGRLPPQARELLLGLAHALVQVLLLRERERQVQAFAQHLASLRQSDIQLQLIADAIPQIVWSALPDGTADYFNRRWWEYTGLPQRSTPGGDWRSAVHPEDQPLVRERWLRSIETGMPFEVECRLRDRDGDFRWVLARALPVRGERGEVLRWIGTCTDVEQQVRYRRELLLADQRKDEFLAMLAHELRSPLAPIASAAQALRLAPEDPQRVQRSAEIVSRQVRHLSSLLGDLMDVSRIRRGSVALKCEPLTLQPLVQEALEQVGSTLQAHGQHLALTLAPQPLTVEGDPTRLVQVIANLLTNASRYTPDGGRIALTLAREQGHACLCVVDDGMGIEPELLPHVFEPFRRGPRRTPRGEAGLGLGLALVKSLVELHGGHVRAHSEGPGRGSRFCVQLPLADVADPPPRPVASAPPGAAHRRLHVMVVEDNADAASALGSWLRAQGHRVSVETDPWQALARSRESPAEVYLLDIGLPGIDGYELAHRLRQQPGSRDAMLVALTGYGEPQALARAREAGFDHHIVKPPDPEAMSQVLAEAEQVA